MKNVYQTSLRLRIAIDSFILFPSDDINELLLYTHYVDNVMCLKSGKYVFDLKSKPEKEGEEKKRGLVFIPDTKNSISNIRVKEVTSNSIVINCDIYMNSKGDYISLAFCEEHEQKFIAISPIQNISTSGTGEKKYYSGYKMGSDSHVYTAFEF